MKKRNEAIVGLVVGVLGLAILKNTTQRHAATLGLSPLLVLGVVALTTYGLRATR